jgi:hypothetical protein
MLDAFLERTDPPGHNQLFIVRVSATKPVFRNGDR